MNKRSDQMTNREIERMGHERWHALRKQERERAEQARLEEIEEQDFQRFSNLYEQNGGKPSDARAAFEEFRRDIALARTKQLDEQAQASMFSARRRAV
jgi:hypothetical protein